MQNAYRVLVNNKQEFKFSEEQLSSTDIQQTRPAEFHILKNHKSYKAILSESDFSNKTYQVKINSNVYEIKISGHLDQLVDKIGLSLSPKEVSKNLTAPMPGLILDVFVQEGEKVKAGDYLLVLEAMKMENSLTAARDGVIKKIHTPKGMSVEKNQVLIEMD